jgi:murein L,D-transpeptidase YafK
MRARSLGLWLILSCLGVAALGGPTATPAVAAVAEASAANDGSTAPPASQIEPAANQTEPAVQPPPAPYSAADRDRRLAEKSMSAGSPLMIRIFKQESELELWMLREGRFELFATYPICFWSGRLGPKLREGDRQAPEGLYSVGLEQLYEKGRRPRSFDIGFPNAFDRAFARTGSYIFVHGGCTSIGCFAMTNPAMDEIYALSERALREGQDRIEVHAFPFRMTEANLAAHAESPWHGFWLNLKEAYDAFERTRVPPRVAICDRRYIVGGGGQAEAVVAPPDNGAPTAFGICEDAIAGIVPIAGAEAEAAVLAAARINRIVSRSKGRRSAGRNVRANYAAARKARVAAHARRVAHRE